ncbi:MAG TPA: hypothetical protein VEA69_07035 [Tepidisphaeraceae bacterium]|nr:hypothetical protein [Tepidisphaeraceae bacterium]
MPALPPASTRGLFELIELLFRSPLGFLVLVVVVGLICLAGYAMRAGDGASPAAPEPEPDGPPAPPLPPADPAQARFEREMMGVLNVPAPGNNAPERRSPKR